MNLRYSLKSRLDILADRISLNCFLTPDRNTWISRLLANQSPTSLSAESGSQKGSLTIMSKLFRSQCAETILASVQYSRNCLTPYCRLRARRSFISDSAEGAGFLSDCVLLESICRAYKIFKGIPRR